MTEYVHLIGAEKVENAGHAMAGAAEQMRSSAGSIETALFQHQQFLNDWLQRYEQVLAEHKP